MSSNTQRKNTIIKDKYALRIDRARELFLQLAKQEVKQAPFLCRAYLSLAQGIAFALDGESEKVEPFFQLAKEELSLAELYVEPDCESEVLSFVLDRLCGAMLALNRFIESHETAFLFDARQLLQNTLYELSTLENEVALASA